MSIWSGIDWFVTVELALKTEATFTTNHFIKTCWLMFNLTIQNHPISRVTIVSTEKLH